MYAAGVGGIADGAGDVGPVRHGADPGRDRGGRTAGGAAGRDRGAARVARVAMQAVAGEPAKGEGRRVGAAEHHGAGASQVGDDGVVVPGEQVALDTETVGGGPSRLVGVGLDRDGHAGHRPGVLAARQRRVHRRRLGQGLLRAVGDDGVDRRVRAV
jgi:hypothetical protein